MGLNKTGESFVFSVLGNLGIGYGVYSRVSPFEGGNGG